ncbi:retrovirus-related pol polyprotein from transposon TNT 1-94 [Tanacetum coccineum]
MCKQCLITSNHDVCVLKYVNDMNSCGDNHNANVSKTKNKKKHKPKGKKPKNVGFKERLASPKPSKPRICLRWSPTGRMFNLKGKIITSSESECQSDCSKVQIYLWCVDSGCSKHMTENLKLLINFIWKFLGTVRFGNDHIVVILGYDDLQWGNILIIRVYFVEGLGHNLFSVGQCCDSYLEVAFRRNTCFVRNLEGVDLLKGNRTTNLYTINLHEMASASPICLMALLLPNLARKKHKGISPPKPVPNSKQRLHLLHMNLCGPMRVESINGKRYILNDREDIGKLDAKGDIGFFIGYSATSCAYRWTKDHPMEQVIGEPSRLVLTRNQLQTDGDICIYALTVSTMEPKNVKEAMTDPAWIDSMQEELLQFKRLNVWVLVPPPYNIQPLTLKWLFKNKHDEENTVIRNKTRLVVRGYHQEEGIDF